MSIEQVTVYKVRDRIFHTNEEANEFLTQENLRKKQAETIMTVIENNKKEIIEKVKGLYHNKNYSSNTCNCDGIFSVNCLVHLCTCPAGHCDRHTNLYFQNHGCYWCNYTDCSKYYC